MITIVEIRAAEGGEDAKLLVAEQTEIYSRLCQRRGFSLSVAEARPGFALLQVDGPGAAALFAAEAGGHRWQRVPPTEKRGRMQTSTITVAVLDRMPSADVRVRDQDLTWATCRGTGAGGQKRNKTESTVLLTHRPTGIQVRCEVSRDQRQNRVQALRILQGLLRDQERARTRQERAESRREQVGTGMRGDKRRTIRTQDGEVCDHVDGRRWRLKDYLRGEW